MSNINNVMKESKVFTLEGNIINMVIGVTVSGAFNKTVTSLINDILMSLLGALTDSASFSILKHVIHPVAMVNGVEVAETATLYGSFLQNILDFLVTGVCMFFAVKATAVISSRLRCEEEVKGEAPVPVGPTQEELLTEIRDLLKGRGDMA